MNKRLGFGCMRLPLLDKSDNTSIDKETLEKMVDIFLEKGFYYFDTAYTYHNYMSEEIMREALVKRYSRDKFTFATKLPMRDLITYEDQERIFNEQLNNCGVEYFDYYLLHNIGVNAYKKACELDSFGFGFEKKKEGKIKNFGLSFHDTPELLDEILTNHPEIDFVQLQINYIDWENPGIQSKRCYEVARKHNKPIIVMEPCKGGNLANLPKKAEEIFKEYNPNASNASWAIRFAASQEGVIMVLSGMNSTEQVLDNTSYMTDFKPLNEEEYKIINKAIEIINENTVIPCTGCRYCEKDCPQKIAISDYFALYNNTKLATTSNISSQFVYYLNLTSRYGKAEDCIGCEQCEKSCPQHLKISELLKDVSKTFDITPPFPTRKK